MNPNMRVLPGEERSVQCLVPTETAKIMLVNSTVSSQPFHLPLTLDMDGCGWRGTHLSDTHTQTLPLSLSHTHSLLSHSHPSSLPHTFASSHQCTVEPVRWPDTFKRLLPRAIYRAMLQVLSSIKAQLFSLISHSAPVSFKIQSDISCCAIQKVRWGFMA